MSTPAVHKLRYNAGTLCADTWAHEITEPLAWLADENIQQGIQEMLEFDHCVEEEHCLMKERFFLQEWMMEEWAVEVARAPGAIC